ncbi:MAG: hypothetical protein DRP35_09265 [Candidatus Zixiibacteriota bacterium]|nr:MAG: hypothetical protein DRP35_09265 [candidate division Zixibacteria bacterium]
MQNILFSILLLIFTNGLFAETITPEEMEPSKTSFIITHPTVSNIKNFQYLIDNNILKIPNVKIYGVFYKFEKYDYAASEEYIKENNLSHFQLVEIDDSIPAEKIRQQNACSDDFYLLAKSVQGIIFLGGDDLPPATYNNQTNLLTGIDDPQRHYFELSFVYHLLGNFPVTQDSFPILKNNPNFIVWGICLGMQTINVALDGSLIQDISSELYGCKTVEDVLAMDTNNVHKNYERLLHSDLSMTGGKFHPIRFSGKSFLKAIADTIKNTTPLVYSYHHQCVKVLSPDFTLIATSLDGKVPEAMHHKIYPNVYGFQFHFEYQYLYDENIKVLIHTSDKSQQSLRHYLKQHGSLVFQYKVWEYFSKTLMP